MKLFRGMICFLLLAVISGCSGEKRPDKLIIAAGIPPTAGLVSRIAGDRATVISILPQGRTPHDFTPRIQTLKDASSASVFFSTGMPFEKKVEKFMLENGKQISDVSRKIKRIAFHDGGDHSHRHHDGCTHDDHDPHVWLSCRNAIAIAANIRDDLTAIDPDGKMIYQRNFELLKSEFDSLDKEIAKKLQPHRNKTFFVYHPAFGYFADDYKLKQRAIELNGREASAPQLARITKEAKAAGVSTIFVQEQFNPGSALALARQINGDVVALDPLASDLSGNLRKIASALDAGFTHQKK